MSDRWYFSAVTTASCAEMKYCSRCGKPVVLKTPEDDNRERFVCDHCDTIHYQNPRIIVGCLPVHQDRILLCLRAIEPRKNYWTLPAGFMENGETSIAGAQRETQEEACASVSDLQLYTMFDLPHISQVYMFYRANLDSGKFGVGAETLDADLFRIEDIPWDRMAFPVVTRTLKLFIDDRDRGEFRFRNEVIDYPWGKRDKVDPGS
jgi:ADP-ribose pyrophosphatase YjhB (NUDIX family)